MMDLQKANTTGASFPVTDDICIKQIQKTLQYSLFPFVINVDFRVFAEENYVISDEYCCLIAIEQPANYITASLFNCTKHFNEVV